MSTTYESQREQNDAPDGGLERLKDAERVRDADGRRRSPDDDRDAGVHERSHEVDDAFAVGRDGQRGGCHVRRAALVPLDTAHTRAHVSGGWTQPRKILPIFKILSRTG